MGAVKEPVTSLYEADFLAWTRQQAGALRARKPDGLDYDNLIEEVESMGRQQQAELINRLAVLLAHLLKWQHQPESRPSHGRSWQLSVKEQRRQIARLMARNPSLQPFVAEAMREAYGDATIIAARESGLAEETFPAACPYPFDRVVAQGWLPG